MKGFIEFMAIGLGMGSGFIAAIILSVHAECWLAERKRRKEEASID